LDEKKAIFPIRHIAEVTGVLTVTLRAWERRYGLLKPERTSKGHRLYSDQDIDKVRQILNILKQGVAISQVRQILANNTFNTATIQDDSIESRQMALQNFALSLDITATSQCIYQVGATYPLSMIDARLIRPVLHRLQQSDSIYQQPAIMCLKESVYMAMLKRRASTPRKAGKKVFIFAALTERFSCLSYALAQVATIEKGLTVLAVGHHGCVSLFAGLLNEKASTAIVLWADEEPEFGWENDIRALRSNTKRPILMGGELATRQ